MIEKDLDSKKKADAQRKELYTRMAKECAVFLIDKYKVNRAILIGSLVKGVFHERSDIDLVIEGLPPELYIKALTELYNILPPGVEINLIPYEDAFDSMKEKAVAEGQLIYG
ncbi:MAG: nucleotidyltransferase domain-containing protein [Candidatus Aminicenantes bacterium]|nr:nucleotidyltransferase domain-containing protein [Candidatus Aminicenantes bacterium]